MYLAFCTKQLRFSSTFLAFPHFYGASTMARQEVESQIKEVDPSLSAKDTYALNVALLDSNVMRYVANFGMFLGTVRPPKKDQLLKELTIGHTCQGQGRSLPNKACLRLSQQSRRLSTICDLQPVHCRNRRSSCRAGCLRRTREVGTCMEKPSLVMSGHRGISDIVVHTATGGRQGR